MKNIYDTLEFNQIKNKVISFCVGDLAKDKLLNYSLLMIWMI